jgi:flagellar basal-body rod protein FlgF
MDNSTFVSLSLATALRRDLDLTTNNIANANTAGFKSERIVFDSLLHEDSGVSTGDGTAFVIDAGSYMDETQGSITHTGNTLDIALQGPGWFSYRTPDGQIAYGRDGRLNLDAAGNLVTLNGAQVLDEGGGAIVLPADVGSDVSVTPDGTITANGGGAIGKVGIFALPDLQSYERIGAGLFVAPVAGGVAPQIDENTKVMQGAIEQSNVHPVVEMTRMMDIQRSYERAVKLMNGDDELRREALRRIGGTG